MRALVKPLQGPGLELREVPEPIPGYGEVKIKVMRAGLCGTDLHILSWDDFAAAHVQAGQTIGHEFYGEIVELGPDVVEGEGQGQFHVGQRVSVEGHVVCGNCRNCRSGNRHMCPNTVSIGVDRDGAFADYVVVPVTNVWIQPDEIDPELGALFDPFGNAVHTAFQFPLTAEDVLVTGAGPIGIMCAAIARHAGARNVVLTDINDERLDLAKAIDGIVGVNTAYEDIRNYFGSLGMTEGFDVGLEISGAPVAMAQMIDLCAHGAKIALLGLPARQYAIDWNSLISHMLTIKGVYGRAMYDTWFRATYLMTGSQRLREQIRKVITHRFAPENWEEAFETARSGHAGKIILEWND
ncbi:L-threonine 3-dehydrogenase [Arcanobacterium pinnipediorum]|uniref:L-threonine 3-dehydrogenase n=1 Tax=Arcanobacterium pinnipediorum TaxID=1503041 RepID=A0ABY5AGX8_9ACTO|nr:L-threonine 3-dehydrogenase [Arcanobacterium pinnipediorum]USR79266.1 L-threonine 3-dehydrogenase [Arcanobacterium pinnipediorum]